MSILRAVLSCVQATCYQIASTPPNKTPPKGRFDGRWYSRISPLIFTIQQPMAWLCTSADVALVLAQQNVLPLPAYLSNLILTVICPSSKISPLHAATISTRLTGPNIHTTPLFFLGVFFTILGMSIRLSCYRALGTFFTFDLTIMPSHKLITSGPYAIVRHPAYIGSLCAILGLCITNLTPGGWIVECDVLGRGLFGLATRATFFVALYGWWIAVGIYRAQIEDGELRKLFGKEWDQYAAAVPYWFVPGIL
ncbi:unnamed protein product [Somion occarium]|uniref:Protein-S-isoprenylcysteine O-methyltransferase n=1 Tax=Somion occarium TaxID=3059160 RepID=A0ABP1DVS5_9APHY